MMRLYVSAGGRRQLDLHQDCVLERMFIVADACARFNETEGSIELPCPEAAGPYLQLDGDCSLHLAPGEDCLAEGAPDSLPTCWRSNRHALQLADPGND